MRRCVSNVRDVSPKIFRQVLVSIEDVLRRPRKSWTSHWLRRVVAVSGLALYRLFSELGLRCSTMPAATLGGADTELLSAEVGHNYHRCMSDPYARTV